MDAKRVSPTEMATEDMGYYLSFAFSMYLKLGIKVDFRSQYMSKIIKLQKCISTFQNLTCPCSKNDIFYSQNHLEGKRVDK